MNETLNKTGQTVRKLQYVNICWLPHMCNATRTLLMYQQISTTPLPVTLTAEELIYRYRGSKCPFFLHFSLTLCVHIRFFSSNNLVSCLDLFSLAMNSVCMHRSICVADKHWLIISASYIPDMLTPHPGVTHGDTILYMSCHNYLYYIIHCQ